MFYFEFKLRSQTKLLENLFFKMLVTAVANDTTWYQFFYMENPLFKNLEISISFETWKF